MLMFVAIGVNGICWLLAKQSAKAQYQLLEEAEKHRFSDDNVLKEQLYFERRLNENSDLPDAIGWREAYIYRHLMSKWFGQLIGKYRHNKVKARRIRADWLMYMYLLEEQSMSVFLGVESENQGKGHSFYEDAWEERKSYQAIENAFAAAIGNEAIEQLRQVREREHNAFDWPT